MAKLRKKTTDAYLQIDHALFGVLKAAKIKFHQLMLEKDISQITKYNKT